MLIGSKKQILYIRDTKSRIFREAYFILRSDPDSLGIADGDIVSECERIVNSACPKLKHLSGRKLKKRSLDAFSFYMGLLLGSLMFFASFLLIRLILT